ncbi:methionyl-tRNA formyltransferase [Candidatus Providencia siddallii]|uniref:Methionyl-tRNA formyltransferase n=1 Tax=Candidatus Providencia siddallii TaxID=1715285 RepID=A0ABM9NNR5_9GAMM
MFKQLKIIFAGTTDFAAKHLLTLIKNNYQIVGVITTCDKPSGRGKKIKKNPVKILSEKYFISFSQPINFKNIEIHQWIKYKKVDLLIVVAYGLILPQSILDIPKLGCINVHASLLPRWRGPAPIQYSIHSGDDKTGITIIKMDVGIDTGDILYKSIIPIKKNDTSATLCDKLSKIGSISLIKVIKLILNNKCNYEKQNNNFASYTKKILKKEAKINWNESAIQIERYVRAFNPWPISYFLLEKQLIKVWKVEVISESYSKIPGTIVSVDKKGIYIATGNNTLNLIQLQLPGKKSVDIRNIINYYKKFFIPNQILK